MSRASGIIKKNGIRKIIFQFLALLTLDIIASITISVYSQSKLYGSIAAVGIGLLILYFGFYLPLVHLSEKTINEKNEQLKI